MPRGKGDLFNIDNLQDAIKAIEEIYNIIHKTGVSAQQWMDDNEKIVKEYEKLKRLSTDLFKQDEMAINARNQKFRSEIDKYHEQIKLKEQQIEQEVQFRTEVEKRLNAQKEVVQKEKELQDLQKESARNQKQLLKEMQSFNLQSPSFSINNLLNKKQQDLDNKISSRTEQLLNDWVAKNGNVTEENYEQVQKYLQQSIDKEFSGQALRLNVAAQGLQLAANTLKSVGQMFLGLFKQGIANQSNAYENSFTNISVRNGTTRSQYYGAQSRVNNILGDMGLRENIATSQVQDMWNTLASEGIKVDLEDQKTTTQAIETILTNQIVPYLDMSSAYMQKLANDNPNLMKQVRGIGTSIQNVEGSNVVANEYLQDMMTNLSPMGELAQQELGLQYADTLGQLEDLRNQGLSDSQIGELYSKIKGMVEDPYNTISNGDTLDRLTFSQMMANNEDMHDSSAWLNYLTQNLDYLSSGVGKGNRSNLTAGIYANSLGGSASLWDTFNSKDINAIQSIIAGDKASSGVNIAANIATSAFTNDQNQTNKTLQNITLENLMNELSVVNQWMGNWTNVIVGAIQGIGNILLGVAGAKLGSSILSGKASGLLGKAGNAIGTGLSNAGSTLSGVGITGGAATALGAAGVTAGIAGAAYGISTGIGQLQEGETGLGVTNIAGGAAMGVGAGMLLASNPVGWFVGAIGGAALLGARLYESANAYKEAGKVVEKEFNNVANSLQEEYDTREDNLYRIKENLQDSDTLEQARSELISSGLLTEEEINEARTANKESLEALTDKYLEETGRLSDEANDLLDKYSDIDAQNATNVMGSIKDWYDEYKNVENETNFDTMYDMVKAVMESENFSNLSESDQEFAKKQWNVIQTKKTEGTLDQADLEWFLDRGDNGHLFYSTVSGQALEDFTRRAQNRGAGVDKYNDIDANLVSQYLLPVVQAETKEEAETALKNAKAAGLSRSTYSEIQETMDKFGIESYRQGINDVPEDQLAILHQGEAVLTASTANELRNLTDTYRETATQSYNIDAIIQNQTSALITKMNEIIRVITTGVSGTQSLTRNTADAKVWDSMIHMESTKAF